MSFGGTLGLSFFAQVGSQENYSMLVVICILFLNYWDGIVSAIK